DVWRLARYAIATCVPAKVTAAMREAGRLLATIRSSDAPRVVRWTEPDRSGQKMCSPATAQGTASPTALSPSAGSRPEGMGPRGGDSAAWEMMRGRPSSLKMASMLSARGVRSAGARSETSMGPRSTRHTGAQASTDSAEASGGAVEVEEAMGVEGSVEGDGESEGEDEGDSEARGCGGVEPSCGAL